MLKIKSLLTELQHKQKIKKDRKKISIDSSFLFFENLQLVITN